MSNIFFTELSSIYNTLPTIPTSKTIETSDIKSLTLKEKTEYEMRKYFPHHYTSKFPDKLNNYFECPIKLKTIYSKQDESLRNDWKCFDKMIKENHVANKWNYDFFSRFALWNNKTKIVRTFGNKNKGSVFNFSRRIMFRSSQGKGRRNSIKTNRNNKPPTKQGFLSLLMSEIHKWIRHIKQVPIKEGPKNKFQQIMEYIAQNDKSKTQQDREQKNVVNTARSSNNRQLQIDDKRRGSKGGNMSTRNRINNNSSTSNLNSEREGWTFSSSLQNEYKNHKNSPVETLTTMTNSTDLSRRIKIKLRKKRVISKVRVREVLMSYV